MKRFAIASLSIICLSLIASTSVKAETRTGHLSMAATTNSINTESLKITPFELVSSAYQGSYKIQGIGGFASFPNASFSKMMTAKELVSAAIEARQLPEATQTDRAYLNSVELQLLGLKD
jgi:hypothetical protein